MKPFKRVVYLILSATLTMFLPLHLMAQPTDPCFAPEFNECPIDSNLIVLFIAVIAIAARKAYLHKISV